MKIHKKIFIYLLFILISCHKQDIKKVDSETPLNTLYTASFSAIYGDSIATPEACTPFTKEYIVFRGSMNSCPTFDINKKFSFYPAKNCLERVTENFSKIKNETCKDYFLLRNPGNIKSGLVALIKNYLNNETVINNNFEWSKLNDYYTLVGIWYKLTKGSIYKNNNTENSLLHQEQINDFMRELNSLMWSKIETHSKEFKESFENISEENKIFDSILAINTKVIDSMLNSDLSPELKIIILGDTLIPVFDRIKSISRIHDLSCKFQKCDPNSFRKNPSFWLNHFFISLVNLESSHYVLDLKKETPVKILADTLVKNRVKIKELLDYLKGEYKWSENNLEIIHSYHQLPYQFKNFSRIFNESFDRMNNYNNFGLFNQEKVREINFGFDEESINNKIEFMRKLNNRLFENIETYKNKKTNLFEKIKNNVAEDGIKIKLENELNRELFHFMQNKMQMDQIRKNIKDKKKRVAEYFHDLDKLKEKTRYKNLMKRSFMLDSEVSLNFSANSIPYSVDMDDEERIDIEKVGLTHPKMEVKRGDRIEISIEGNWSPTCALRKKFGDSVSKLVTGPDGFYLNPTNSDSFVESTSKYKSEENYYDKNFNLKGCLGLSTPPTKVVTASIEGCVNYHEGKRTITGTRHDQTKSISTSNQNLFNIGLRLEETPFPEYPVGSLLLVEMPIPPSDNRNNPLFLES